MMAMPVKFSLDFGTTTPAPARSREHNRLFRFPEAIVGICVRDSSVASSPKRTRIGNNSRLRVAQIHHNVLSIILERVLLQVGIT